MAFILKLTLFYQARPDWLAFVDWLQCLNTRFLVEGNGADTLFCPGDGLMVGVTDISTVLFKRFVPWAFNPTFDFIGTNIGLILKIAPPVSERLMGRYLYRLPPWPVNFLTNG